MGVIVGVSVIVGVLVDFAVFVKVGVVPGVKVPVRTGVWVLVGETVQVDDVVGNCDAGKAGRGEGVTSGIQLAKIESTDICTKK